MARVGYVREILDALEALYGNEARNVGDFRHEEPLDDLVLTILSQNTNDKLRDRAFANMTSRYPSWESVANADIAELADVLKIAGMSGTKPPRIQFVLAAVKDRFGGYTLKELRSWKQRDVREYLTSLPGVGPKTSAVVECFDLGMPAFPVDTHITRISKRLGWAEEKAPPEKIQASLEAVLPKERFLGAHLNFLAHGRGICNARKPCCQNCALSVWCALGKGQKKNAKKRVREDLS